MKNEVITDDIFRLQCELRKKSLLPSSKERFIVCSEKENFLDYFSRLFSSFEHEYSEENSIRCIKSYENVEAEIEAFFFFFSQKKITIVILYDIVILEDQKFLEALKIWLQTGEKFEILSFLLVFILPESMIKDTGITAYSEQEIKWLLSSYYVQYKDWLDVKEQYELVNLKEIYCCEILDDMSQQLKKILENAFIKKSSLTNEMHYDLVYIRDLFLAIFYVQYKGMDKEIYNVSGFSVTDFQLAINFMESFNERELKVSFKSQLQEEYHCLDSRKIKNLGWKTSVTLKNAIYRTGLGFFNEEYRISLDQRVYNGKLNLIRKLELEILREVDKICKKYNIKYFLVGGSLLGAVRHNGFIPWDDDLDIGMLRRDYEKFRKVCLNELPAQYSYQSYKNEENSHYIFDKIRVKDTIFSTKFSSKFEIENGVFLDVLVYDKTSNIEVIQKIHIALIRIWKRAINVKWVDYPRKNLHYRLTKFLLPVMRKIPFSWFHFIFEKILKVFNNTNSYYLIDGVGMNLKKGAFPKKWFDVMEEIQFEDMKVPIPQNYHEYLVHWYGSSYMEIPVISQRLSGHEIYQLDLGHYIEMERLDGTKNESIRSK